jgi:hypothetical protein
MLAFQCLCDLLEVAGGDAAFLGRLAGSLRLRCGGADAVRQGVEVKGGDLNSCDLGRRIIGRGAGWNLVGPRRELHLRVGRRDGKKGRGQAGPAEARLGGSGGPARSPRALPGMVQCGPHGRGRHVLGGAAGGRLAEGRGSRLALGVHDLPPGADVAVLGAPWQLSDLGRQDLAQGLQLLQGAVRSIARRALPGDVPCAPFCGFQVRGEGLSGGGDSVGALARHPGRVLAVGEEELAKRLVGQAEAAHALPDRLQVLELHREPPGDLMVERRKRHAEVFLQLPFDGPDSHVGIAQRPQQVEKVLIPPLVLDAVDGRGQPPLH